MYEVRCPICSNPEYAENKKEADKLSRRHYTRLKRILQLALKRWQDSRN